MQTKTSKTYTRIKSILCQHWNIPPFTFDEKQRAGEILLQDAVGALELIMATDPLRSDHVVRYIYRERIEAIEQAQRNRAKRISELQGYLVMLARVRVNTNEDSLRLQANKEAALKELEALKNGS